MLLRVFQVLSGFRNICAHDERLYCAVVRGARFSDMYSLLARVLPDREIQAMFDELGELVRTYQGSIAQDVLYGVFEEMNIQV